MFKRSRQADPASPSLIDLTAPAKPVSDEEFTPEQVAHARVVLRGLMTGDFMGRDEDELVLDAAARLLGKVLVLP